MEIRLRFLGLDRLRGDARRWARKLPAAAEQQVRKAAELAVRSSQQQFKGSRTRALYAIRGGKRVRRKHPRPVTAPPDKLAVFEGTYRRAISYDVSRRGRHVSAEVGPVRIRYARRHEFGLDGMPRRQVLTPGVKAVEKDIFRLLGKTFEVVR